MKILKTIVKYISLVKQGATLKDKLIIFFYVIKLPIKYMIKQIFNINYSHKLIGEVTVKSKNGIFFCGNNFSSVGVGSNFHEQELRKYFNISEGTFIDIGANIGKYTIMIGRKIKGRVIAIEPEKKNFEILKTNVKLNKLNNIILINSACSSKNGQRKFFLDETGTEASSFYQEKVQSSKTIAVQTKKLDNILNELGIKKVDLNKIDVEGAEADVLKGAIKTLKNSHPEIIFEAWDEQYLKKVKKILDKFNYKIKKIAPENYIAC